MSDERARRVPVAEAEAHADYSDAFEVELSEPDVRTAEEWVRSGLEEAPPAMRLTIRVVHRFVLGLRLAARATPGHVLGWQIVTSEPDVVQLEASGPLMRGVIVGRRVDPTRTRLTTFVSYESPMAMRFIWAAVGPLHRRVAPYLLERVAISRS